MYKQVYPVPKWGFGPPVRILARVLNLFGQVAEVATDTTHDEKAIYALRDKLLSKADWLETGGKMQSLDDQIGSFSK